MNQSILQEYLKALEITEVEYSLTFVQELQEKHVAHFSFNSVSVLLGEEIALDTHSIAKKIITQKRGGYCFEHNALMYEVLKFLGYEVRLLIGKVLNNRDVDVPRTHRITLLSFEDNEYLVDVGFGAYTLPFPLLISPLTLHKEYRLKITKENDYLLEITQKKSYFTLYKFNLHHYTQADCVMGNFYSSNYKDAVFVNNLVASLILKDEVRSLRNDIYHRIFSAKTEVTQISSEKQLHAILKNDFMIPIDELQVSKLYNNHLLGKQTQGDKTQNLEVYLQESEIVNFSHKKIQALASSLARACSSDEEIAKNCFTYVRDQIHHSGDFKDDVTTLIASDVLKFETGWCYSKSILLCALLRANGIPTAFIYQRLSCSEYVKDVYCLHGLNAIHLKGFGWYRVDARGNKEGVNATFNPPHEKLAFKLQKNEYDLKELLVEPLPQVVDALTKYTSYEEMIHNFPDIKG